MAISKQVLTVLDPGLGTVNPALSIPLVIGHSTLGTANVMKSYSSISLLLAEQGQGEAVEFAARILALAGGPVRFMKTATSVAGSVGSVTVTRVSTSTGTLGFATTPNDNYEIQLIIVTTGTVGVGVFKYSLDDGRTFSENITIPAGGTFAIPNTNLTATFTPGGGPVFFEAGDKFEADCVAPMWNATDIGAAVTAILADPLSWDFLVLAGKPATSAAAATIGAALDTHMTTFANKNRWRRAIMDGGKDAVATIKTSWASTSSKRIAVCVGDVDVTSSKPFAGWGAPMMPSAIVFASRAAAALISEDLARGGSTNPLPGVLAISHDEFQNETMDEAKFSTLRTWEGAEGFFIEGCRLKSPAGSDFEFWQHGRTMDAASKTTYEAQAPFHSNEFRTKPDKTIDTRDALRVEKEVDSKLEAVLGRAVQNTGPKNASGTPGHVSDFAYRVSRTEPILTSKTLATEVAIRPLGYAKFITTTLGFAANVAAAA
jgi:hypothetical protein